MQSSSQIITTNKPTPSFLQAGCHSCCPTNSVKALKGKISHSMDLLIPSSYGGLPTLSLTTNSSWLPGGRVAMPLISPLMPVTIQIHYSQLITHELIKRRQVHWEALNVITTIFGFWLTSSFSWDRLKLGRIPKDRQKKQPMGNGGVRFFFTGSIPFSSPNQQYQSMEDFEKQLIKSPKLLKPTKFVILKFH